jgi:hypothetical protein
MLERLSSIGDVAALVSAFLSGLSLLLEKLRRDAAGKKLPQDLLASLLELEKLLNLWEMQAEETNLAAQTWRAGEYDPKRPAALISISGWRRSTLERQASRRLCETKSRSLTIVQTSMAYRPHLRACCAFMHRRFTNSLRSSMLVEKLFRGSSAIFEALKRLMSISLSRKAAGAWPSASGMSLTSEAPAETIV